MVKISFLIKVDMSRLHKKEFIGIKHKEFSAGFGALKDQIYVAQHVIMSHLDKIE